jgi:hypothetical protein
MELRNVCLRDHGYDPRQAPSLVDADLLDPRMRVAGQQEAAFEHSGKEQISGVARLACHLLEPVGSHVLGSAPRPAHPKGRLKHGLDQGRAVPFSEREASMRRAAAYMRNNRERLSRTLVDEMGKPIVQARREVTNIKAVNVGSSDAPRFSR